MSISNKQWYTLLSFDNNNFSLQKSDNISDITTAQKKLLGTPEQVLEKLQKIDHDKGKIYNLITNGPTSDEQDLPSASATIVARDTNDDLGEKNNAANKLQALFRGYNARKKIEDEKQNEPGKWQRAKKAVLGQMLRRVPSGRSSMSECLEGEPSCGIQQQPLYQQQPQQMPIRLQSGRPVRGIGSIADQVIQGARARQRLSRGIFMDSGNDWGRRARGRHNKSQGGTKKKRYKRIRKSRGKQQYKKNRKTKRI